jgi:hypothetical protein
LRCDPAIAADALARGWLVPADPGLFGAESAQSWTLKTFEKEFAQ